MREHPESIRNELIARKLERVLACGRANGPVRCHADLLHVLHHRLHLFMSLVNAWFVPARTSRKQPEKRPDVPRGFGRRGRSHIVAEISSVEVHQKDVILSQQVARCLHVLWHVVCSSPLRGENMIKIDNILVATDFGEASASALAYGREFARTFGARLHVLHVLENPAIWVGPDTIGVDIARLQADLEATAQAHMDRLVTLEDRQQLNAFTVVRTGRATALEIADQAKLAGIDVIIMGTHGRGAVTHLLMGSVAEKVVRIAPCPVLTVRHPEHEFILPDALQTVERARH